MATKTALEILIRDAIRLMPLGTKARAEWIVKASEAIQGRRLDPENPPELHMSSDGCVIEGEPGASCGCQSCRASFGYSDETEGRSSVAGDSDYEDKS